MQVSFSNTMPCNWEMGKRNLLDAKKGSINDSYLKKWCDFESIFKFCRISNMLRRFCFALNASK